MGKFKFSFLNLVRKLSVHSFFDFFFRATSIKRFYEGKTEYNSNKCMHSRTFHFDWGAMDCEIEKRQIKKNV